MKLSVNQVNTTGFQTSMNTKSFISSIRLCERENISIHVVCVYIYIYVTVNLYNQVICILPDFFS